VVGMSANLFQPHFSRAKTASSLILSSQMALLQVLGLDRSFNGYTKQSSNEQCIEIHHLDCLSCIYSTVQLCNREWCPKKRATFGPFCSICACLFIVYEVQVGSHDFIFCDKEQGTIV